MRTVLVVLAGPVLLWVVTVVVFYLAARRTEEPTRLRDALRLLSTSYDGWLGLAADSCG